MTKYRLPEALGGGEVDVLHGMARDDGRVDCDVPEVGIVTVPFRALTEVQPPEPPIGAFVHLASYYGLYERIDRGWIDGTLTGGKAYEWETLVRLNSGDTPVRLAPVPFVEPVKLRWEQGPVGVDFAPEGLGGGPHKVVVVAGDDARNITALVARDMAHALWAAADAAEATP